MTKEEKKKDKKGEELKIEFEELAKKSLPNEPDRKKKKEKDDKE